MDAEFDEEVQFHLDRATQQYMGQGLDPSAARRQALLDFGGVERFREATREARGVRPLEVVAAELRTAIRALARTPVFTIVAVATLAIGIGAGTTMFSVVRALSIRPLPFSHGDRLVWISNGEWGRGQRLSELSVQVSHLEDLRTQSRTLEDVAGYYLFDRAGDHTLQAGAVPERVSQLRITQNFLAVLGVAVAHGRAFSEEEASGNGPRTLILTDGFWRRRFGGAHDIVGRILTIDGEPATVVGVLPRTFDFASIFAPGQPVDFLVPFPLTEETDRQGNTLALVGLLAPDASVTAAQGEVTEIAERAYVETRNDFTPWVQPIRDRVTGNAKTALMLLSVAVMLVMLIVCVNMSSLLLARGATREREMAVRAALGAQKGRLLASVFAESMVLSTLGGTLGLALAVLVTRVISGLSIDVALLNRVSVDGHALIFCLASAVAVTLVVGTLPAFRVSSVRPGLALAGGFRSMTAGPAAGSLRTLLVGAEVALACLLLIGAGLLVRSVWALSATDLGFQPRGAVSLRIDAAFDLGSRAARLAHFDDVLRTARSTPEVEMAALTDVLPVRFNRRWCLRAAERADDRNVPCRNAYVRLVSEQYLGTMGIELISGRAFTVADDDTARPVVLINDVLSRTLWPGGEAVGKFVRVDGEDREVVGVTKGMRHLTPEQAPGPEIFFPLRQMDRRGALHLIVRGQPYDRLLEGLRDRLGSRYPDLPLNRSRVLENLVGAASSSRRALATLLVGFAGFATLLAILGIYGVISYSVTRRRKEMGVRLALGALPGALMRGIVRDTGMIVVAGLAVGMVVAWPLRRLMRGLLYGVGPSDPVTFVVVPLGLLAVALVAGFIPARRAARVNPVEAFNADG